MAILVRMTIYSSERHLTLRLASEKYEATKYRMMAETRRNVVTKTNIKENGVKMVRTTVFQTHYLPMTHDVALNVFRNLDSAYA